MQPKRQWGTSVRLNCVVAAVVLCNDAALLAEVVMTDADAGCDSDGQHRDQNALIIIVFVFRDRR